MRNFKWLIYLLILIMYPVFTEAQVINKVVAVVNDEIITQQDVFQLLAVLYAQYAQSYKEDKLLGKMEEVKKDILKQMIEDRLILSRAREVNIKVTEQEVNERLDSIKKDFPSEKDFYDMLETQGITISNLKERYRDQIMMKKIIDLEVRSKLSVVPSEVSRYYEEHKTDIRRDERYKVRHIFIKADDEVGFELAKVEIQRIYNKLREGGDFAELARLYSKGPKKEEGGDMGYIKRGEMLEELDEAIFALNPGGFSEPIKSDVGYHIFKVEDVIHSGYLSFEEVQQDIRKMLFQEKLKMRLDEWLAELRSKAYISIK